MRSALVIASKDLRQRLRDRSAIILAFIAPVGLALIVSLAFGSGFGASFHARYLVIDHDHTDLSKAFADQVLGAPQIRDQVRVERGTSETAARADLDADRLAAAFVIPAGFQAAATGNQRTSMTVLTNPKAQIGATVGQALADAYVNQINASRLSVITAVRAKGATPSQAEIAGLARDAAATRLPVNVVDGHIGVRKISGANYFGPAMTIFFLFFTTGFVARSLLAEREEGTLPRILATPIPGTSVMLGKALTGFLLGSTSVAVMFGVMSLLFDVNWGDPLALIVLSVLIVLAVMSVASLVQLLAKTQQQAEAFSSLVAVSFSLLGGSFFPIFQLPTVVQKIALVTPNAWALRGFADVAYDGATLSKLGPNILAMGTFIVVAGGLSLVLSRRLTPR